jgi:TolB protein
MKNQITFRTLLTLIVLLAATGSPSAQIDITVTTAPGRTPPIWVSMTGLSGEAAETLRFDLYVQGFNFTNAENAQYLIAGSNNGNLQARVTDNISKSQVVSKAYSGASLRRQAHAFADDFVEAIGRKGIAKTKIAYKAGSGRSSEIYVADFDGFQQQAVTADKTIVAAPVWATGKFGLCYVSYKLGNPAIFYQDLTTGSRSTVAYYGGSSISPAVSPDGRRVAMILSKGGSPDVYVSDIDGTNLKRLTVTREAESSPCWSADAQWVGFATEIKGRRTLARVPVAGGTVQMIPTPGFLNPTEPEWSPDGKWLAFTAQMGTFRICVAPAAGGTVTELIEGEDPSWAPNSRTLAFTRRQSGGRTGLSLLDVLTKQVKDVTRISGISSQPGWQK